LEFCQKHVRDRKFLQQATEDLAYIINKLDQYANQQQHIAGAGWIKKYINDSLHYIYYFANITNDEEFSKKLESVGLVKRENIMGALARKIEQQGIEKGIEKNKAEVAKSMLEKNLDLNLISEVTKLTEKEINDLKLQ
jgi:hypothetical protein